MWRSVFCMHSISNQVSVIWWCIYYMVHIHTGRTTNRNYSAHILARLHIRWWDLVIGAEDILHLFRWPDRMATAEHKPPLFLFVLFQFSAPNRYSVPFPVYLLSTFSIFCSFFKTFWEAEHIDDEIELYEQKLSWGARDQKMNIALVSAGA